MTKPLNNPKDHDAIASARRFEPVYVDRPFILNSLPKCGTVMLRNILLHFIGPDAMHIRTLEPGDVSKFEKVDDLFPGEAPLGLVAHFPLYPQTASFVRSLGEHRMVVLIRHPLDNCYSLARHITRPGMRKWDKFSEYLIENNCAFEEAVWYCLHGYTYQGVLIESVQRRYSHYLAWQAQGAQMVRYEDIVEAIGDLDSKRSEGYFRATLGAFGIDLPDDWRERIEAASASEISWTATKQRGDRPSEAAFQRALEIEASGLLKTLGY